MRSSCQAMRSFSPQLLRAAASEIRLSANLRADVAGHMDGLDR
jgi:hypothetical protein